MSEQEPPTDDRERPGRLGPYQVEEEVGHGGMGTVYRAGHVETGETVAVKVLPPELARHRGFRERFRREVRALAALDHPNIVHLLDAGTDDGVDWYAMEFVPGASLSEVVQLRRRLPWDEAVDLAIQICHALKHAHDRGVVHRDLKLSNLIATPDGQVKLTDFGIAKVFEHGPLTATGGVVGSADYMSPEQAAGKPATRRSDLYSLGVILYAMVTGRLPFSGKTALDVMQRQRFATFDAPGALLPGLPADLDRLIVALMAKEPADRPADAAVTARRLEVIRRKEAFRAEASGASDRLDPAGFSLSGETPYPKPHTTDRPTILAETSTPGLTVRPGEREIPAPSAANSRVAGPVPWKGWPGADEGEGDSWPPVGLRGDESRSWTGLGLGLALLVLLAAVAWSLWPASDARLAARGEALLAAHRAEDDLRARDTAFGPLLERHPTGPWADLARSRLAEIEARQRLRAARLTARTGLRADDSPAELTEPERLFRQAEARLRDGDLPSARARFAALATLFAADPDGSTWVEAARVRVAEIDRRPADEAVRRRRAALDRARLLSESGHRDEARDLCRALITLYADDPAARDEVTKARRLIPPDEPSTP